MARRNRSASLTADTVRQQIQEAAADIVVLDEKREALQKLIDGLEKWLRFQEQEDARAASGQGEGEA